MADKFKVRNRDWRKFLNKQKYSECQLISAINAYYWLSGKTIRQETKRYENLVDLVCARYGSAICINKAHRRFGLEIDKEHNHLFGIKSNMLPMELNLWHKCYGFHSVLVVDCEAKSGAVRVTNFSKATSMYGWIFWEDLQHFVKLARTLSANNDHWQGRKFKLIHHIV